MKKTITRLSALVIILTVFLTAVTGCKGASKTFEPEKIFNSLLNDVSYSGELTKIGDNAKLYFQDLPDDTAIEFYTVGGYYADELALFTFKDEAEAKSAEKIVANHISELRKQFLDYVPEEVTKIDNAIVARNGNNIFLCITDDYKNAKKIIAGELVGNDEEKSSETSADSITEIIKTTESAPEKNYPQILSKSGEYQQYGSSAVRVDNSAFELYTYVDSTAKSYADIINKSANNLKGKTNVYVLAIPTAIGIVLPDDIVAKIPNYDDQGKSIEKIYNKMSDDIKTVNCFENMMLHRDEYLYFRTDFHWNGKGAYYAYETFCKTKGISAISLSERTEKKFDGFLGELYWNDTKKDSKLANTPDVVEAYLPKSTSAKLKITDKKGDTRSWDIIYDVTNYKSSMKYSTFAGADNPISEFNNPDITDASVCIVVKESFGNALLPFLVDHYNTIYEIDYRYWKGNLTSFAKEKNATDLIFANNISMIRSNYLVGLLSGIAG